MIIRSGSGLNIRGTSELECDIQYSISSSPRLISASTTSNVTILGATFERTTGSLTYPQYSYSASVSGTRRRDLSISISDPNIASVSGNVVSRVSNGTANLILDAGISKKSIPLNFNQITTNGNRDLFLYYNNPILANAETAVKNLVTSSRYATDKNLFSSFNVRNPNFFGSSITNLPTLMSRSGRAENGSTTVNISQQRWIPISPLHVACCGHYFFAGPGQTRGRANGMWVEYVTNDNQVIRRTIVDSIQAVNDGLDRSYYTTFDPYTGEFDPNGASATDMQVCRLDSPLPDSIGFVKYFDPIAIGLDISTVGFHCVCTNQFNNMYGILATNYYRYANSGYGRKNQSYFDLMGFTAIRNDSGSPNMILINNEMVIFNGASLSCYAEHAVRDTINSFMTTLGGGYQLTMYS